MKYAKLLDKLGVIISKNSQRYAILQYKVAQLKDDTHNSSQSDWREANIQQSSRYKIDEQMHKDKSAEERRIGGPERHNRTGWDLRRRRWKPNSIKIWKHSLL